MNISQIKQEAAQRLQQDGGQFRKLVLIHTAVTAGASLLLLLVGWLAPYIAPDGGLSNLGTQAMLYTGQILLQVITMLALPFWDAGLIYCALQVSRSRSSTPIALTEGFHRLAPVLVAELIQSVIYLAVSIGSYFLCSILISFLPMPEFVYQDLITYMTTLSLPFGAGVWLFLALFFCFYCVALCVFLVPKMYLYRLSIYRVMGDEPCGGLQAVLESRLLMKGKRKKLFLLDLSFWWFHLLSIGVSMLSMGELLLSVIGISIPGAQWFFPIVSLIAQVALYWWAKPKLAVSQALFYQRACEEAPEQPEKPQASQIPWQN